MSYHVSNPEKRTANIIRYLENGATKIRYLLIQECLTIEEFLRYADPDIVTKYRDIIEEVKEDYIVPVVIRGNLRVRGISARHAFEQIKHTDPDVIANTLLEGPYTCLPCDPLADNPGELADEDATGIRNFGTGFGYSNADKIARLEVPDNISPLAFHDFQAGRVDNQGNPINPGEYACDTCPFDEISCCSEDSEESEDFEDFDIPCDDFDISADDTTDTDINTDTESE